jgi:hypothetical protein
MNEITQTNLIWANLPDRDTFLMRFYQFFSSVKSNKNVITQFIKVSDVDRFYVALEHHIKEFISFFTEDEELEKLHDKGLISVLDNMCEENEDLSDPEFSGNDIFLTVNELFRINLIMNRQKTPIRLLIKLSFNETGYFPELVRIEKS